MPVILIQSPTNGTHQILRQLAVAMLLRPELESALLDANCRMPIMRLVCVSGWVGGKWEWRGDGNAATASQPPLRRMLFRLGDSMPNITWLSTMNSRAGVNRSSGNSVSSIWNRPYPLLLPMSTITPPRVCLTPAASTALIRGQQSHLHCRRERLACIRSSL